MAEKRIRRGLTKIVLDKIDEKGKDLDQRVYGAIRRKIEAAMAELEEAIKNNKPLKLSAAKKRRLDKFTKEELELYLSQK